MRQTALHILVLTALLSATFAAPILATPPGSPSDSISGTGADVLGATGRWLGPDGQPLPFASDDELLEFLRTAEVTSSELIPMTTGRPLKLMLEKDGVRARAIFRTVDVEREQMVYETEHARGFRDNYVFEVAAYELSRLLGLDNVPPATVRKIGRENGSIQLWVEEAMGVVDRLETGIDPRHEQLWIFQKQNMVVFDTLIFNFDRNPGNILIDSRGKVWFVDHTRSFKVLPFLSGRENLKVCERQLYNSLRALDPKLVREKLKPYLRGTEIEALLKRQKKLVKAIDRKIAKQGEDAVLFSSVAS